MLVRLLKTLGHHPIATDQNGIKYRSPFNPQEKTPSFYVLRNHEGELNNFKDFSTGNGGDIYEFTMKYFNIGFKEAKEKITALTGADAPSTSNNNFSFNQPTKADQESTYKITKVQALQNKALLQYLNQRGITDHTIGLPQLTDVLQDVYYEMNGKRYFGIGFKNDSGGHEIRNQYFKGSFGKKDITFVSPMPLSSQIKIFEGFLDYLSYLELSNGREERDLSDYVVLNSLSMLDRVLELIRGKYELIELYLDNDKAGNEATSKVMAILSGIRVIDKRKFYQNYKDINDYLLKKAHIKHI